MRKDKETWKNSEFGVDCIACDLGRRPKSIPTIAGHTTDVVVDHNA